MCCAQTDDRAKTVGDKLQAFTASFPGETFDEAQKTDELCNYLNIVGHKVFPKELDDVEQAACDAVYAMEMPFNSGIPIVSSLVLRRARAEGALVVLNGHGPDEMLAGYPSLQCPIAAADSLRRLRLDHCFGEIRGMTQLHDNSWKSATAKMLGRIGLGPYSIDTSQSAIHRLFRNDWLERGPTCSSDEAYKQVQGRSELEQRLKWEFFGGSIPRWLQMEDRISMAEAVMTRQPFLDYRLIEFAFTLGNRLKVRNGSTKFIMRKAMQGRLPPRIVDDPRKQFFPGPNIYWLKGALKSLMQSSLAEGEPMISTFIDPSNLRSLVDDFLGGDHRQSIFLWRLLNTELWMRSYFR